MSFYAYIDNVNLNYEALSTKFKKILLLVIKIFYGI